MTEVFLVGLGGIAGALARHLLGERIDARTMDTLAVNLLGSFLLGALVAAPTSIVPQWTRLLMGVGFCGAFTTFSTLAFETVRLAETGDPIRAGLNGLANLVGAIGAVLLGGGLAAILV